MLSKQNKIGMFFTIMVISALVFSVSALALEIERETDIGYSEDSIEGTPRADWHKQISWDTSGLFDVYFSSNNIGWTVGVGTILHTSDAGNIWYEQDTPVASNFYSIFFVDNYVGWAAGSGGVIVHTTDGGNTWIEQNDGYADSYSFDLFFLNETHGWAAGGKPDTFPGSSAKRVILKTTDGGNTWTTILFESDTSPLEAVYFTDPSNGWAIANYVILHTSNGGDTWVEQDAEIIEQYTDLYFTDTTTGWITGIFGTLLHTTDSGDNWNAVDPGTTHHLSSIHFSDSQNGWICGGNNTENLILSTNDGGNTWNFENIIGTSDYLYGIFAHDASHGWTVGIHGNIVSTIQTYNLPPGAPSGSLPEDGATNVNTDPALSVMVSDFNYDALTVEFYDASNNNLIGIDSYIDYAGAPGRAYLIWNGLTDNTTYNWDAIADDDDLTTQSDTWTFSTGNTINESNGVNIALFTGWNMLGWFQDYNTTAQSLGENTSATLVLMFNASTQEFMTYVMNTGYDNFPISRGMGVFIRTNTLGYWHGEG